MGSVKEYFSMIKFSHTIFAMPFAMVGLFYGVEQTKFLPAKTLLFVVLAMVFARSAAMAFNRLVDRDIDAQNARTAVREIPSGKISPRAATIFVVVCSLLFVWSAWMLNPLAFKLSPIALVLVLGYSLTKRFTWLCHLVLGVALAVAPVGAYIALMGEFHPFVILIAALVALWCGGFDILYALQDEEFDRKRGLNSIPVLLGRKGALLVSALLHLAVIAIIIYIGVVFLPNIWYIVGGAIFSLILVFEHVVVKPSDISKVNLAFATMNGVGSLVYGLFTILAIFF